MCPPARLERIAALWQRYADRLPKGDHHAVGAGYAGAVAALAASGLFIFLMGALEIANSPFGLEPIPAMFGVVAIPIVVPAAFAAGVVTWRYLPDRTPYFGVIAGVLATVGTYLGGSIVLAVWFVSIAVFQSTAASTAMQEAAVFAVIVASFAFIFTFWVTLPVGGLGGYCYEKAGTLEVS